MNGIAATLTSWSGLIRRAAPPRAITTRLERGGTLGMPGDAAQQRRVLEATLALLAQDAPVKMIRLDERAG
ncbi:MAG: hypothetical protein GY803_26210 [Chloroflexi bacterium]|nr:hypothetical protein [Chloroflexota bacterium]